MAGEWSRRAWPVPLGAAALILLLALGAGLLIWWPASGQDWVLERLLAWREALLGFQSARPVLTLVAFFALYLALGFLPLSPAPALNLAAGALFGLLPGLAVASLATALGATLACALSRRLWSARVARRYPGPMEKINRRVEEEGAYYVFALRFSPVPPFLITNLLVGLTSLPLFTFFWVTLLGKLPLALLYVNAGQALGSLTSLDQVVSWPVLLALGLLGVAPLLLRKYAVWLERKRRG